MVASYPGATPAIPRVINADTFNDGGTKAGTTIANRHSDEIEAMVADLRAAFAVTGSTNAADLIADILATVVTLLPLPVPVTITWSGSWPARTTATTQTTRRVFFIGNPGGAGPTDMLTNDVWMQG